MDPHPGIADLTIIQSAITSARSPEEVLERLDKYHVDSYITEQGDLMIRCWQIAAEGFVPEPQVARFRTRNPSFSGAESLEWVSKHLSYLRETFGGKWIAVARDEVVASADELPSLMLKIEEIEVENPFVTQIPDEEITWHTLYGN